jgi:hypothetical protein
MEADGIIDRYAIGGAVGTTFYLEPVATLDVDVFVAFHREPRRDRPSDRPGEGQGPPAAVHRGRRNRP